MPSKRGGSRRRYGSKRRNRRYNSKKGPTTKTLSKKIRNIENNIIELKWHDLYDAFEVARLATFPAYHLTSIAQGDEPFNRNGNKLVTTSVQLRFSIYCPRGQRTGTTLRCIIFWDRQSNSNGLTPTTSIQPYGLLDNTAGAPGFLCPYNYNAVDRYSVIYDKTWVLQSLGRASNSNPAPPGVQDETSAYNQMMTKFIKLKTSRIVKYGTNAATFPVTNALYALFLSDVPGADEAPEIEFCSRVYYRDA